MLRAVCVTGLVVFLNGATAAAAETCSVYTNAANTPRTSLGVPYDMFDASGASLVTAQCAGDDMEVVFGNTKRNHLIYSTVYAEFTAGEFTPIQLRTTNNRIDSTDWILTDRITGHFDVPQHAAGKTINLYAYMCQVRVGSEGKSLKCGCNEQSRSACLHTHGTHMGTWNYQRVQIPAQHTSREKDGLGGGSGGRFPNSFSYYDVDTSTLGHGNCPAGGYLETHTWSAYGTRSTTISNYDVFRARGLSIGSNEHQLGTIYSRRQAWNADESRLVLLAPGRGNRAYLHGTTYAFIKKLNNAPGEIHWSRSDPKLMYGVSGTSIIRYLPESDTQSVHATFDRYQKISFGKTEGALSLDDTVLVTAQTTTGTFDMILYDLSAKRVLASRSFSASYNDMDNAGISLNGEYIHLYFNRGSDRKKTYFFRYNKSRGTIDDYYTYTAWAGHSDWARDAQKRDVYVLVDPTVQGVTKILLEDKRSSVIWGNTVRINGARTRFTNNSASRGMSFSGHISGQAVNRPGWILFSFDDPQGPLELVNVALDGSERVERWGFHHSVNPTYYQEAKASVSPSGRRAIHSSNCGGRTNHTRAMVIEAR